MEKRYTKNDVLQQEKMAVYWNMNSEHCMSENTILCATMIDSI